MSLTFDTVGERRYTRDFEYFSKISDKSDIFITGVGKEIPGRCEADSAGGHDLGNHTQNHENMKGLTEEECQKEMLELHAEVKALTGYDMFLFRSPYGNYDNRVLSCAKGVWVLCCSGKCRQFWIGRIMGRAPYLKQY